MSSILNIVVAAFALLGCIDRMLDNRFGLGEAFERGVHLFGSLALSMIGMIVMVPLLSELMQPLLTLLHETLRMEPSIIPASLIANDMGGAAMAVHVAADPQLGMFNGLIVSCMMGCTIAFTIPVSLTAVCREQRRELLLGMLCGIAAIPAGCLAGGMMAGVPFGKMLGNLLPMLALLSRALARPMRALSRRLRVNEQAVMGFVATLASSVTTFAMMEKMDKKGVLLNAAFAISAAFTFADHLAFTMAFNNAYAGAVVLAKLFGGITAILLGCLLYGRLYKSEI